MKIYIHCVPNGTYSDIRYYIRYALWK